MREDRAPAAWPFAGIAVAGIIAAGLIVCSVVVSRAVVRAKTGDETIRVIGSARKPIKSDLAIWRGRVARSAPTVSEAYAGLQKDVAKVNAYLVTNGVPGNEINALAIATRTLYAPIKQPGAPMYEGGDYGSQGTGRRVIGYELSQQIEVQSSRVDLIEQIARKSTQIIGSGITFESQEPMYLSTKLNELKVSMQAEAARDARARAEQIAASSGCRIGKLRFARMNVPQITALYSSEMPDAMVDDTTSIDKRISAVVVAGYSIR